MINNYETSIDFTVNKIEDKISEVTAEFMDNILIEGVELRQFDDEFFEDVYQTLLLIVYRDVELRL